MGFLLYSLLEISIPQGSLDTQFSLLSERRSPAFPHFQDWNAHFLIAYSRVQIGRSSIERSGLEFILTRTSDPVFSSKLVWNVNQNSDIQTRKDLKPNLCGTAKMLAFRCNCTVDTTLIERCDCAACIAVGCMNVPDKHFVFW